MKVEVGFATDIGRVRERNEDSILVDPPLYVVADGMGGHRGGQVASRVALETLEALAAEGRGTLPDHVRGANRAVWDRSVEDERLAGMGTTLTAARVDGASALIAHVGDSRAYLLRDGELRQLTADHTLVARMVQSGEITEAEAEVHPHKNVLTRALGTDEQVEVDEDTIELLDGDRLLLCSDGLTGMVTEDQIQAILENSEQPQQAADRLVKAANRAGGIDNISVVVLAAIGEGDEASSPSPPARRPTHPGHGAPLGAPRRPRAADRDRRAGRDPVVGGSPVVRRSLRRERRDLPGHPADGPRLRPRASRGGPRGCARRRGPRPRGPIPTSTTASRWRIAPTGRR